MDKKFYTQLLSSFFHYKKIFLKFTNSVYETKIDIIVSQHQKIPFGIRLKDINNEISNYDFKDKIIVKQILKNAFLIEKKIDKLVIDKL